MTDSSAIPNVLLIDDDVALCKMLQGYLSNRGWNVTVAHRAAAGLAALRAATYKIVILDVMLPDFDGLEVLRRLRKEANVYVLLLTARGDEMDRIVGLELGADDYLPKPFNIRELLARMRAIVRRGDGAQNPVREEQMVVQGFIADLPLRTISFRGQPLDLTDMEFDLLSLFLERPGLLLSREELVQRAFRRPIRPNDRSLDMLVLRLRRKLDMLRGFSGEVKTVRSNGYMLLLQKKSGS